MTMASSTLHASAPMPAMPVVTDADGRIENAWAIAEGFDPEVTTRPLRLHTPMVEHGGLGGHCFSADFARYLASVKPRLVVGWQMRVQYWWASAYGRERVKRGFTRRYGPERGAERYQVALCLAADYHGHAETQAFMDRHSAYWCAEQAHIAQRFASARAA